MIPAYKVTLYTSIGASMYMMGRLVLVSFPQNTIISPLANLTQGHKTWFGKN
jgi:hypothetical protein